jgi:hypothetical protein
MSPEGVQFGVTSERGFNGNGVGLKEVGMRQGRGEMVSAQRTRTDFEKRLTNRESESPEPRPDTAREGVSARQKATCDLKTRGICEGA